MVTFTERAADALTRSTGAARRFDPAAKVRLVADGAGGLRAELTDETMPGDRTIEHESGFEVIVAQGIEGTVDAGEHDVLFLIRDP